MRAASPATALECSTVGFVVVGGKGQWCLRLGSCQQRRSAVPLDSLALASPAVRAPSAVAVAAEAAVVGRDWR